MRSYCWACSSTARDPRRCWYCKAPTWSGYVTDEDTGDPGVYVLWSDCGMAKIGVSTKYAAGRARAVCNKARRSGAHAWPVVFLVGAGFPVEHWLHEVFAHSRDVRWARDEGLPHPSEWFWPTPALSELVRGWDFVDALEPELLPGKWMEITA